MWEWFDWPLPSVAAELVPLLRDEIAKMMCNMNELDGLIEQDGNYLSEYHSEIMSLKNEIKWWEETTESLKYKNRMCKNEIASCLGEIGRMRVQFDS